jgi:hypothetical protein
MHLPAPLDAVLGVVTDADGSLTIPVNVQLKSLNNVNVTDIVLDNLFPAVGSVIGTAFLNAPAKAANSVLSLIPGLPFGGPAKPEDYEPVVIHFDPGDATLSPEAIRQLDMLLGQMDRNDELQLAIRHDFGGGDIARLRVRSNPTPEECEALAGALRQRKRDLLAARNGIAEEARGELASGFGADVQTTLARLRAVDAEVARTEDAMDHAYDLTRPGADHQAERRTRSACVEVGQARVDEIASALSAVVPDAIDRIHPAHPQFAPADGNAGGTITLTLTAVKKQK